jgi:hypothetical protein
VAQKHNRLSPARGFTKSETKIDGKMKLAYRRSGGENNEDSTEPLHDLASNHEGQNRAAEPKTHNEVYVWAKSC